MPVGNSAFKAPEADVCPVPPCDNAKGLVNVNELNVGEAEVLTSCGVLTVKVFEVPVTVTPFVEVKDITPLEDTAVPDVPTKVFEDVFARAYAAFTAANNVVEFCEI